MAEMQDFEELSEVFITYPLPFSGRERDRKTLFPLLENGSALQETPVFSQEFTTKVVVLFGVWRKDGFGVESIVSYSMFRFVFHGFK